MEERPSTSEGLKRSRPHELQEKIDVIAAKVPLVTAKPSDLDHNQKRWLIVGICLHSIISPVLRKYVVPILTVLYNELTINHNIDTQTYPTHLKQYPPTNAYLNYESVNNNKAKFGYQKAKYDYTIKSVVDVSKLFLQTHMAHYIYFDDTCDSSALLGLIINIDKFPVAVKSNAENVRGNIRNPWAHCDFTEWDAVKYADSFQLMENLVKNLCLSSTEELQIKRNMEKWKISGQQFLGGTTLGLELVNDIRQQIRVLAEYTQLVAIEQTDENCMRIKNVLKSFEINMNRLTELEKDVETRFSEINERLVANQDNPDTLFANPADLDDNQKRWVILGICLHSVISPTLRKYVVPILTVLYDELTLKHKIDTQTYPTYLTKYPPTNIYLNYEAVNNNKAKFGNQKAKYDFTIKSVVDLSKLFLQTHIAQYTGFDDTCDSTAVLGLIINIEKFPPVVKNDAKDVRIYIRNSWARCNFTEWDAVTYADSFQRMEKLIKDLSLSSAEENQVLGEMKKWEINGQCLLSGTSLGLDLFNEFRQQTQVLAEYIKLVSNETDTDSKKINRVLENFDILLNRLTELDNNMQTKSMEINKRLLAKDENRDTLFVNSDYSLPFAGTSEEFINLLATGTYESFENRVFLCGSCACGKSTLASVLIGSPIPLKWKSTDGLVIHFGRNGINLETYEMVPLQGDDRGQNVWTKVVIGKPNHETSAYQRSDSHHDKLIASSSLGTDSLKPSNDKIWKSKDNIESSDDKIGKSEDLPDTNTITSKKEKCSSISLPELKKVEAYAVHDDILKEVKSGQYKIKIAPSDLVDFGGQRSYDMTHQLFIQHGGTFVVMFDGSRDFHEPLKEYPTGDISNESIVKHWVDSILTYCVDDNDVMPMILFAATHRDLLSEELQKKIKINLVKKVTDMFGTHERKTHFVFDPVFFINGTVENDQEIQNLKNKLVTIARNQPSWGLRRPMIWVPLELMISNMKKDNINIILKTRLAEANEMNGDLALSVKQLDDFLLTQHALGKIMYFDQPELNKFIILYPPALVNVLRSFITEEMFWPEDETLNQILRNMTDTGKIYKKDLLKLWQQKRFQTHIPDDDFKEFVVQVLTHLDILVLPKRYSGNCDTHVDYYLVPCTIKNKMPMSFLDDNSFANRTLSLVYRLKMSSIPSALSLKLIGAVSSIWPIMELNGRPSLYHSSAVLCVDGKIEFRIIVGDTKVIVYLTHKSCKSSISPDIAASIQECITSTLEVVLKCYLSINGKSHQKANVSDLFEIEIGEVCNRSPCVVSISRAKLNSNWVCNSGNEHFSKYPLIWFFNKKQKECPSTCPGLETKRLTTSPSEKQLSRLADQLDNNSCRELMIHLGLQQKDWKDIEDCYTLPLIMRIMALHTWKTKRIKGKPTKSFSNLLDALTAIGDHRHLLCKVFREDTELIDIADVRLQKVPSDDVLNGLPMNLGNCAIQLGIELGITMSSIDETMVRHHKDMYSQIYDILRKWKCSCEVKPTIYRLMLALERVHIGGLEYLQDVYLRH